MYFVSETTATEQVVKTEQRRLRKFGFSIFASAPCRPKRKQLTAEEKSFPTSGGSAIITDLPARENCMKIDPIIWNQARVSSSFVKFRHLEVLCISVYAFPNGHHCLPKSQLMIMNDALLQGA